MSQQRANSANALPRKAAGSRWRQANEPPTTTQKLSVIAGLLLGVLFIYAQVASHDTLSLDDDNLVYKNQHVTSGLNAKNFVWAFGLNGLSQWHPMTWLSHQLDCQLFGTNPRGHHLHNVALHAACAVVLFLALLEMTGALWPSAFVAAVFAFHPLNVESVAWIAERKNELSALFGLLTVWAYAVYARRGGVGRYLSVAGLLALGLMSKPMLATLPCALLLLDVWPLRRFRLLSPNLESNSASPDGFNTGIPRRPLKVLLMEKVPLLVMSAISCQLTIWCLPQQHGVKSLEAISLLSRVTQSVLTYTKYLVEFVWPTGLSLNTTPTAESVGFASTPWMMAGACVLLIGITLAAVFSFRRRPYLAIGWFWYLGILFPVSGLIQVGTQFAADRYAYLPLIGISLGVAWLVHGQIDVRKHRHVLATLSGCVLLAFAVTARAQTAHWRTDITLYQHALAVGPHDRFSHINLGDALTKAGRTEEALHHFQEAVRMSPRSPLACFNLAATLHKLGRGAEALPHYQTAVQFAPHHAQARINLGCLLHEMGQSDRAATVLEAAVRLDPDSLRAHYNMGVILLEQGRLDEAALYLRRAVAISPRDIDALNNLGIALASQGRFDVAIEFLEFSLSLEPNRRSTQDNLRIALARKRRQNATYSKSSGESEIQRTSHTKNVP